MPDGSVTYSVYGFHREPLATFNALPQGTGKSMSMSQSVGGTSPLVATPSGGACNAFIILPAGNITAWVGQIVNFNGYDDSGALSTLAWAFGDGRRSTGVGNNVSHAYTTAGTYTVVLTASATGWTSASASVTVTVFSTPVLSLTASKTTLVQRDTTTLTWSVTGGSTSDTRTLTPGPGLVAATGQSVQQPMANTTYTLTVANGAGSMTASVAVTVNGPPPPVINAFSAAPPSLNNGQSTTLTWNVSGSNSNWPITVTMATYAKDGTTLFAPTVLAGTSLLVTPLVTTTYTLAAATDAPSLVTKQLTVVVAEKPVIEAFWASPEVVAAGQGATLQWGVANYKTLSLSGVGAVTGTSATVSLVAQTTYTLTATNDAGSVTSTVTVYLGTPASSALAWTRSMIYGFGHLLGEETPTGFTFIQTDQVGSPNLITNALGVLVGTTSNLPFGERFGNSGTQSARRYTNHEDQAGSPIYMQARMYLPAYGKFAEVDPAYDQSKDDPESWNLYNYCTNNPITHTDPDGREELIAPSQAPSEEGPKKENPQKDGKKQGDKQKEKEKEENRELTFREKWQLSLILGPSAYAINVRMVNGKITSGASSNTKKADKAQTAQAPATNWASTSWGLGAVIGGYVTYTVDSNQHAYLSINLGVQTPGAKFGAITYGQLNNDGLPVGQNDVHTLLTGFSDTFVANGAGLGTDRMWSPSPGGITGSEVSVGTMTPGVGAYFGFGVGLW